MKDRASRNNYKSAWERWFKNAVSEDISIMPKKKSYIPHPDPLLEGKLGLVSELKNFLNVGKVKTVFRMGTEIFNVCQHMLEKPTWWNVGKAVFGIGKVFVDDVEIWAESFFDGDEWQQPYTRDFNQTILVVLQAFPFTTIKTAERKALYASSTLMGPRLGGCTTQSYIP
jgi:hypothetical protein